MYQVTVSAGVPATNAVAVPTAAVSAVSRLPAVRSLVAPMANWFGPGLADVVAVSVMLSVEPSGRVKRYSMVSPSLGLPAVRSTVVPVGGPDGVYAENLSPDCRQTGLRFGPRLDPGRREAEIATLNESGFG